MNDEKNAALVGMLLCLGALQLVLWFIYLTGALE